MGDSTQDLVKNFIREFDELGKTLGIEVLEVGEGSSRCRMSIQTMHLNGLGTCHGGALFSLADLAFAAAANSHGTAALGVNASMSFMKAVSRGYLYAEGREVSRNHRLGVYAVEIKDETGDIVASFQGMVYRKKDPIIAGQPKDN